MEAPPLKDIISMIQVLILRKNDKLKKQIIMDVLKSNLGKIEYESYESGEYK